MALVEVKTGVQQSTVFECGAASCLYILKMLNADKASDTPSHVMNKTSTWGPIPIVGSSPSNIAHYIKHRCKHRHAGITIRRMGGSSPIMRPWIHSLLPAIHHYAKFNGTLTTDDVVLRFITPASPAVTSHFVVQTQFGRSGCSVMDPDQGDVTTYGDFQDYLNFMKYQTTGLDLVISG
jgi:hypothetical protein